MSEGHYHKGRFFRIITWDPTKIKKIKWWYYGKTCGKNRIFVQHFLPYKKSYQNNLERLFWEILFNWIKCFKTALLILWFLLIVSTKIFSWAITQLFLYPFPKITTKQTKGFNLNWISNRIDWFWKDPEGNTIKKISSLKMRIRIRFRRILNYVSL